MATTSDPDSEDIDPGPLDEHAFQRDLLVVVRELNGEGDVPPCGLDIKERMEHYYEEPVNHGRLYPNLDKLADKGLVNKHEQKPNRRTNHYTLTARAGRELVAHVEWMSEGS